LRRCHSCHRRDRHIEVESIEEAVIWFRDRISEIIDCGFYSTLFPGKDAESLLVEAESDDADPVR
jgi:hypothetical protein